jgi:hypothetical protein
MLPGARAPGRVRRAPDVSGVIDGEAFARLALAWAELHQDELLENWRLARAGENFTRSIPCDDRTNA